MMTHEQIKKAVTQMKYIKEDYPEFWTLHEMILDLNSMNLKEMFANPEEIQKLQLEELKNGSNTIKPNT